jgi:tRNA(Glu) U13 pseudouridine synthase TruD
MSTLLEFTAAQLNQAAEIKQQIEALEQKLSDLKASQVSAPAPAKRGRPKKVVEAVAAEEPVKLEKAKKPGKRKMSAEGRARIIAAQKLRWAKVNGVKQEEVAEKAATPVVVKAAKQRKMSKAGRAAIIAAQKARWAKVRAGK